MKNIKDMEVLELIEPLLIDRTGKLYQDNEEYKESTRKEEELFEQLSDKLTEEQVRELDQFLSATNATLAIIEHLAYIQGMKDMLALLKSLS